MRTRMLFFILTLLTPLIISACGLDGMLIGSQPVTSISVTLQSIPENINPVDLDPVELQLRSSVRDMIRGGRGEDADLVYRQLDAAYRSTAQKMIAQLSPGQQAAQAPAGTLALLVAAAGALSSSREDALITTVRIEQEGITGDATLKTARKGSKIAAEIDIPLSTQTNQGRYVETGTAKIEMGLCPDANGQVLANFALGYQTAFQTSGKTTQASRMINTIIAGHVDENADLTGLDYQLISEHTLSRSGDPANGAVQVSASLSTMPDGKGNWQAADAAGAVAGQSSTANQDLTRTTTVAGSLFSGLAGSLFLSQARAFWQNGYCVEIQVEGAGDSNILALNTTSPFTVRVKQKWENTELQAPVRSALQGPKSIAPDQVMTSPVNYIYTMPEGKGQKATLTLETRSKRGAARRELVFTAQANAPEPQPAPQPTPQPTSLPPSAYQVTGQLGDMDVSGTVCAADKPFTLIVVPSGYDIQFKFDFTPTAPLEGTLAISGSGSVEGGTVEMTGSGTYQFEGLDGSSPALTGDLEATLTSTSNGQTASDSNNGSFEFSLSKIAACAGK